MPVGETIIKPNIYNDAMHEGKLDDSYLHSKNSRVYNGGFTAVLFLRRQSRAQGILEQSERPLVY